MKLSCIKDDLSKIDKLYADLDRLAPLGNKDTREIRSEFAGLLVVSLAAIYENCVKKVLINYADLFHEKFSRQIENKYSYLNSKIKKPSLLEYLEHFDGNSIFFQEKVNYYDLKMRSDTIKNYEQLITSRHSYAHANKVTISLEAAYKNHRIGKYVLFAFEESLIGNVLAENKKLTESIYEQAKKIHTATEINFQAVRSLFEIGKINEKTIQDCEHHLRSSSYSMEELIDLALKIKDATCPDSLVVVKSAQERLSNVIYSAQGISSLKKTSKV
ncbi:HEPN domain-containing protein [Pantoea ananatis]|uniref:HEPN domain-containing protein n=1 Tax=Pantoea ananas TaxID=553 RepID=UPI000D5EA837|nr:HEPN domain-containing protein [Pantoea ananatis]PVY82407.1 hypothetical protein C7427_11036 [Pantoea ananatis]